MITRSKKTSAWRQGTPFFTLSIWVIGILLISPLLYYSPIPVGYVLRFQIDHPPKYPLGVTATYATDNPWCPTSLIDIDGLTQNNFIKRQLSSGESKHTEFIIETEYMQRGCFYKIKSVFLEQGTKEDFNRLETNSLIDYYARSPWEGEPSLAEKELLRKEQEQTELRICPTTIRRGHAEHNDQSIYLINGESFRVISRRARSGPNKKLLTNNHGIWNISIQRGNVGECEEENP